MSLEKAKAYLESKGFLDHVIELKDSTATVHEAAEALGVQPAMIAKTMSFLQGNKTVLILTEGTAKVDNRKYKDTFHVKAKMIPFDEVEQYVGHAPGGVCPFGINEGVEVYLDESLKQFEVVYPAAGNDHSAVKLTIPELEEVAGAKGWVDVCREPEETECASMIQKHCYECGTELIEKDLEGEGIVPYCPQCQQYRFPMYNVAVSMIVTDEETGKILLIQQYGKPTYILVAGYVNRGEAEEDAAVREVREETGLHVTHMKFNRTRFFEPSNTLMCNFTAYVDNAKALHINQEIDRCKWFTPEEARANIRPNSLAEWFLEAYLDEKIK